MQIKSSVKPHPFGRMGKQVLSAVFCRHQWVRRLVLIPLAILLFIAVVLGSIYFGATLQTEHEELKSWALSVAQHQLAFIPNYVEGALAQPEHIDIDIKHKNFQKLAYKRQQALETGFLFPANDDWVPARIRYQDESFKVKLRLKGDRKDHWQDEDGWSYKVKITDDDKTFLGMKRFAIQAPATRGYLNEWFMHKLLAHGGLIGLRYDFIEVAINGKVQPIYALEENFEKRLIEHNRRPEGPIVRFDTEFLWHMSAQQANALVGPAFTAYQMNKIAADERLGRQFLTAQNLLELFRQNKLPVAKVFDVEQLAMFFAVIDLMGYHHAVLLDNVKFYYNPVTALLEPVGYDNYWLYALENEGLLGAGRVVDADRSSGGPHQGWYHAVFRDRDFFEQYVAALGKASQRQFLDDFFAATEDEYQEKLAILHKDHPWYHFEGRDVLYANQQYINDMLNPAKTLHCYFDSYDPRRRSVKLTLRNIHVMPVEILGLARDDQDLAPTSAKPLLAARSESDPISYQTVELTLPEDVPWTSETLAQLRVNYSILGGATRLAESIHPQPHLDETFVREDFIRQSPNHQDFDFVTVDPASKSIVVSGGNIRLDRDLILPAGFTVYLTPGTNIDLSNSAKILSYSPLVWRGSVEFPIIIESSDGTGQGVVVLGADRRSQLEQVVFRNLSFPACSTWQLTGAVTFYESPVDISNCRFLSSRAEDALNIIRSDFTIAHSLFRQTTSDAFDADFCAGRVTDCSFIDCGNDAIDVSGTALTLNDIRIDRAGDKGLSAGENSTVTGQGLDIRNTEIALAGKDMSQITIDGMTLSDCRIGCAAYQKKPEFGPAVVALTNLSDGNIELPYLIEDGSGVTLDGKTIPTNAAANSVEGVLYGVEYGKSSKVLPL